MNNMKQPVQNINRGMQSQNLAFQNQQSSQGYSNKKNEEYYQTPGETSEIRNMRYLGDQKVQQINDQDYYSSTFPYQDSASKQGQYYQEDNYQMPQNYQNKKNESRQYYQKQQLNLNFAFFPQKSKGYEKSNINPSQKINNYTPQQDDNKYSNDIGRSKLEGQKQYHNIHDDENKYNNQPNISTNKYPTNSLQNQFGLFQNTPYPGQQSSKIQSGGQRNEESNNNRQKQNQNSNQTGNNWETPDYNGSSQRNKYTAQQDNQRYSQARLDLYDPNQEDLQASQVPESLPVKKQGTILNLDSSINLQSHNQNSNNSKLYQNTESQKQGSMQGNINYPLQLNTKDSLREQSGYFYNQPSLQRINQESQFERGSEGQMNQNLINKNNEDYDDEIINNMQNSTPHIYNNSIPQSNIYHPSKKKMQNNQENNSQMKNAKGSNYLDSEELKLGDMEQSKGMILNFDESQQDIDENGNLRIQDYQRGSFNNRIYGQYNDISPNNQQRNADFYRSEEGRKESLFKYDPSMFQSVTGYFYPSVNTQQAIASRFNEQEAYESINMYYYGEQEKLKQFKELIKVYLVDQDRVYIQKINRQISGLQSAENLGDYFIRKYYTNQEKRVAGCSRAQVFPVYIGVRGDGNCFYRALMVSYLVKLLTKDENIQKYEELICDIASEKHKLIELEYQGNVRNDTQEVKIILVQQLLLLLLERKQASTKEEVQLFLMKMFDFIANDHDFDYSLVCLCRSMIKYALEMYGTHPIYQEYFLQEDIELTRQKLCTYKEDAEYHAINLSTEIFRHPIQILQLQKDRFGHFEFNESVVYQPYVNEPAQGNIYILLNDGHYDLVFDRDSCLEYFPSLSLFKNHWKYREDLQQLIENPDLSQNKRQHYINLISDYEKFLKDQDHQVIKVRESYAHLQTIYQSKIGRLPSASSINNNMEINDNNRQSLAKSTMQNSNLLLFDTVISHKQSKIKGLDINGIGQQILSNSEDEEISQSKITLQGNQNDFMGKRNYDLTMNTPQKDTNDGSASKIALINNQNESSQQIQIKSTQEDSFCSPNKQYNLNYQANYYNNIESDKLFKLQNLSQTPNPSNISQNQKKNIKAYQEQKDKIFSCEHAFNNNITLRSIICCKIQYEVCYPCFKTRQIIQCLQCKKDILSNTRLQQTCKAYIFYCKKCQKNTNTICLFNQIYCKVCEIEQTSCR